MEYVRQGDALRLLREFGICIVEQEGPSSTKYDILQLVPGRWPMTTSQLSHKVHDGSLSIVDNGVLWSFGEVQVCCTKLVPDSMEGANLQWKINFDFLTSLPMNEVALQADRAMLTEPNPRLCMWHCTGATMGTLRRQSTSLTQRPISSLLHVLSLPCEPHFPHRTICLFMLSHLSSPVDIPMLPHNQTGVKYNVRAIRGV
jgi:hypothetical protein